MSTGSPVRSMRAPGDKVLIKACPYSLYEGCVCLGIGMFMLGRLL
jgi:hypothetical protein